MDPERALIEWVRGRLPADRRVLVDSGDDCAVVRVGRGAVLFKIDQTVEGVHFRLRETGPGGAGRKALARVLSDFAAMGGRCEFAVVGVVLPATFTASQARGVWRGMEPPAREFGVRVVGGDVDAHRGPLAIAVAAIGSCPGRPYLRSGARAGDAILMTGRLGGSHWKFTPRVREALALRRYRIHAMIDLSDGLARDLGNVCEASGMGAVVEESRIPGMKPGALWRGEDYELLFTAPWAEGARIERSGRATVIGRIVADRGMRIRDAGGRVKPLPPQGWYARFGR